MDGAQPRADHPDARRRGRQALRGRASWSCSTASTRSASGPSKAGKWLSDEHERPHSPLLLGRKVVNRYVPYGAVGVIGPWNYPLINNFGDAIPALMAGNTVVLKPATITPLSSLLMAEGLREVGVPEDVFLVALGPGGEIGAALADSVDMLHFTGSTEVGRRLAERGAKRLLPITLELGGNDPMIVLRDANLERAANAAVFGALQNAGQTCISVERVYVEGDAYEPFVEKVVEKVKALRQGAPGGRGQRRHRRGHLAGPDRDPRGARARRGGEGRAGARPAASSAPGRGAFFEPTVLTGVDHSMRIMTEETFGPTLPIMRVRVRGGGDPPGQRLRVRPGLERVRRRSGPRRAASPAGSSPARRWSTTRWSTTSRWRSRSADEAVRRRRSPRQGRDPEVLPAPEPRGHPVRAQPRAVLLPLHEA